MKTIKKVVKKYPVPEGFNPFEIFYDEGSPGLIGRLGQMSIDQVKGVLGSFTSTPRKDYVQLEEHDYLVSIAVLGIKNIATRGAEFGDYILPD